MTLLVLLVCGQTWVWTDSKGNQHYTDVRSTIPKGVRARTTEGAELSVMESSPARPQPDAGTPRREAPMREAEDTCLRAREKVTRAEAALANARAQADRAQLQWQGNCTEVLNRFGEGAYARCMAGGARSRRAPTPPTSDAATHSAEKELEDAKDVLRRAQVSGCR